MTIRDELILKWLGVVVALSAAFDIFANLGDWTELFWFCVVIAIILAVALFRRSRMLASMCLVLALPAQSMWIIDFLLETFGYGLGRTAFLSECGPVIYWSSVVLHSLVIPVALFAVWRLGFERRALLPSLLLGSTLLVVSFLFTPPYKNVNCVFFACDADDPGGGYVRYFLIHSLLFWNIIVSASFFALRTLFEVKERTAGVELKG